MLANNNQNILVKMCRRSLVRNKQRFGIITAAIMLSAFMLFSVLTVGTTYFKMQHQQEMRLQGGDYDALLVNGFTEGQKEICGRDENILYAGTEAYAGYAMETDVDDTMYSGMLWCDEVQWENILAPAREWVKGEYPEKDHELMATREALQNCGKGNLGVGDRFILTYSDKKGTHTREFLISGIWEGYGTKDAFYVSESFYKQSGYQLRYNGVLNLKFRGSLIRQKTLSDLEKSLCLSNRQYFMPTVTMEKTAGVLAGMAGLVIITCISAYLLIYNILYLSVSGNIRYYGLMQTVGMTERQIYCLIQKQMLCVTIIGTGAGLLAGFAVSYLLIPAVVRALGIHKLAVEISFHPAVFLGTILFVGITVFLCSRRPAKIAASVSPVEAMRYRAGSPRRLSRRTGRLHVLWRMAGEQLQKDWKKTGIVMLSLAASLSVFLCLVTLIQSQSAKTVMSNNMDTDLILQNDTLQKENTEDWIHIMDDAFLNDLEGITGIREIRPLWSARIIVPWEPEFSDVWMREFYEVWKDYPYDTDVEAYKRNPEKFYSFLKGIDEDGLKTLNDELGGDVDKEAFMRGETCILYRGGLSLDMKRLEGKGVVYSPDGSTDTQYRLNIAGLTDDPYYGSSTGGAPIVIVSDTYLKQCAQNPYIAKIDIQYEKEYDEDTERKVKRLIDISPYARDFSWESRLEDMKELERAQGNMMEIGIGISLILAWIGLMNYINTVLGSIQNRRTSLAIMESIGMTDKQMRGMLMREGLLYAFGSVLLTATVGLGITYGCYRALNYTETAFKIPLVPVIIGVVLIVLACMLIPTAAYHRLAGGNTIAERIKEFE
ncbi:ABC transporter permease [Lawsonibacter sp. OA9]|nr:ABC transporter permease [Ruminococcus sp. OA3]MCH1978180.1 ABC transporter permease [Lawsonibacter sp. OA9]MCH1983727.1 ABC transporter permease [Ruminococcus sp. OA3]